MCMGQLESESKRRTRNARIREVALTTIKLAGVIAIAVAAPKVLTGMQQMGLISGKRQRERVYRSYQRLLKAGYLQRVNGRLRLTQKGEKELRRLNLRTSLAKPRSWDNKWRVVIFDVPEYRKSVREKVRTSIQAIGFLRLQDSVWIYPYDCEDFLTLLKADFKIGRDVLYMVVDTLEGDRWIRSHFGLK